MSGMGIGKGLLMLAVLFNIGVSGYMLWYFYRSLRNLKKTLTTLQINERRRTNGIGMTELMMCLNLQILVTYIVSVFYVLHVFDMNSIVTVVVGFLPTIVTGLTLKNMLVVVNKVRNNAKV